MEQVQKKAIHVTHCLTEEMVTDFFTKPLQGSLFIKIREYIMGNEEPAYQALPRSVLSNHDLANIQKQKYISTRKHNSEAVEGTNLEHRIKDSDGSRSGPSRRISKEQHFKHLVVTTRAQNSLTPR